MIVEQIAVYLDSEGIGTFDATGVSGDIFIEKLPDNPDAAIAVYSRAGVQSPITIGLDDIGVQIIVRGGQNPVAAQAKAQAIHDLLHGFPLPEPRSQFAESGAWVIGCWCNQGGPVRIGTDDKKRHEYSINLSLRVENPNRRTT